MCLNARMRTTKCARSWSRVPVALSCAGADLSAGAETFNRNRSEPGSDAEIDLSDERFRDGGGRLTLAIYECLKPVIAAVNGPASAWARRCCLAMDIRIASDDAASASFSRAAASCRKPVRDGSSRGSWACSRHSTGAIPGRVFDAQEALRGRLVKEVVKPEELLPRAHALAAEIRDNTAPVCVALIRQMMWRLSALDHPMEAHKIDSRGIYARGKSADVREGVTAFLEKRAAKISGQGLDGNAAVLSVVERADIFVNLMNCVIPPRLGNSCRRI